jgi:hypothetical protein
MQLLSPSVSFILPVRDQQDQLRDRVLLILDLLGELTDAFDLVIVDYGSQDETRELALDLVREFPQVDFLDRGGQDGGLYGAVEAGFRRTAGEIVFVHNPVQPFGPATLQRLWRLRDDDDLISVQSQINDGSLYLIRRRALLRTPGRSELAATPVDRLTRTDRHEPSGTPLRLPKMLTRLARVIDPCDTALG